jgi:enoyl-CoA hydratase/carnithine racemase
MPEKQDNHKSLVLKRDGPIAILTMNRPEVRNAINDELRESLRLQLDLLNDDESVSAVLLTGAGSAFCAGGDVSAMRQRLDLPHGEIATKGWQRQQRTASLVGALHDLNVATIAAVNGAAVGLGMDLALACDFIVSSPSATFAASYVHRGLIPDGGGLYFLPRRIGLQLAKDLIFTGRRVAADEALRIGLADRISDGDNVLEAALAYARTITCHPRQTLMLSKAIVNRSFESSPESIAALGRGSQAVSYTTAAHRSAVEKFR